MSTVARAYDHELFFCEPYERRQLKAPSAFRVYERGATLGKHARSLFVFCSASRLNSVAPVVTAANKRHCLRLLLVFSDTDPTWLPQMLERADLRAIRNMVVHSDKQLPKRILRAWQLGAQDTLIAKATVIDEQLLVVTCSARRLELKFESMPALARIPIAQRGNFELSDDGSYLHWPSSDIHVDIDAIQGAIDPASRERMAAKKFAHDGRYGAAIRAFRESLDVAQSAVGDLSERQVRRIEHGESLSSDSLRRYAEGLGSNLNDFLSRVAEIALTVQKQKGGVRPGA